MFLSEKIHIYNLVYSSWFESYATFLRTFLWPWILVIRARAIQCLDLIVAFRPQFRASISWVYICCTEPSLAVRISRTKSCVTNWATPAQIMEVLFDERDNSFISFFQQSTRWTVASRAPGERILSRIKRDYAHSFHLIVNSYVLTMRVRRARIRLRRRT